jgi:HEAT repeat protein
MEAQICYPYVNRESPFDFLDLLEKPFSKWAQLNIYYFIKIHELPVPSFNKWLSSGNVNVVNFCILMTELFQQQENAEKIIQKLNYPNEITRNLAISACGNLHLFESKEILKNNFRNETLKNQVAIIKSLNNMGDESDIPFLEGIVRNNVISLQLEACRVLYHLSETGRDQLEKINLSMNDKLTAYISHIKDTRN